MPLASSLLRGKSEAFSEFVLDARQPSWLVHSLGSLHETYTFFWISQMKVSKAQFWYLMAEFVTTARPLLPVPGSVVGLSLTAIFMLLLLRRGLVGFLFLLFKYPW